MPSYPLTILMLLVLSGLITLLFKKQGHRAAISLGVQTLCLGLALWGLVRVTRMGAYVLTIGPYEAPWGITLNVGPVEAFLTALFLAVSLIISWYGALRLEIEVPASRIHTYTALYHMSLAAVLGILLTGDLFNSFVFLEVSGLSACGMIIVSSRKDRIFAALKYLILSSLGSGLVLMGIAYLYAITGHLNLRAIHGALAPVLQEYPMMVLISLALFLTGLGLKSAIFPLHIWLPDAYDAAPTTSSAFFSALAGKAPAILIIKLFFGVYGPEFLAGTPVLKVMILLGATGMIGGSLMARKQLVLKRMLAYSSVAQMGYVFLGMGLGTPLGIALSLYHMVAHSLSKACIFLTAGTLIERTGRTDLRAYQGIGRSMPFTLGIFSVCALSMVGIPLFPGFISKFNLSLAAIQGGDPWLLAVILVSSLLNATYYFPVIINGYFGERSPVTGSLPTGGGEGWRASAPILTLCVFLILAGLLSGPILNLLQAGFYNG